MRVRRARPLRTLGPNRGDAIQPFLQPISPTWAQCTVQPDHHVQFRRALYSVPTRYIGHEVDLRGDSRPVRIYLRGGEAS